MIVQNSLDIVDDIAQVVVFACDGMLSDGALVVGVILVAVVSCVLVMSGCVVVDSLLGLMVLFEPTSVQPTPPSCSACSIIATSRSDQLVQCVTALVYHHISNQLVPQVLQYMHTMWLTKLYFYHVQLMTNQRIIS